MDVYSQLEARGGVASARSLMAAGVARDDVRRALAAGAILRVRHGVYGLGRAAPVVLLAAAHGGAVACVSALALAGVWILGDHSLHVWLGPKGRKHPHDGCHCVDHHDGEHSGFGVVSVERALIQAARCVGAECFFVAFESAWRLGLVSASDRASIRSALPARLRRLVDIARPDADSGLESLLRLRLGELGIRLDCQVWIDGVGRVDFVLAGRIILEVDGRLNHDGPSLRHKDLLRDATAAAAGLETLRFDYALVVHSWPLVEAAILARLSATAPKLQEQL